MSDLQETACWLAVLSGSPLNRQQTKNVIDQMCLQQGISLVAALSGQKPVALESLELTATQWQRLCQTTVSIPQQLEVLKRLQGDGIAVLRRDSSAYPESLTARLGEKWLPYFLYTVGHAELLTLPGCAILGAAEPDESALAVSRELAQNLSESHYALVTGYAQGVSRGAAHAALASKGQVIVLLPMGLERFLQSDQKLHPSQTPQQLLIASPYSPDRPATKSLALAREPLVAAMCEILILVDPETRPSDHTWSTEVHNWGGQVWIWNNSQAEIRQAWVDAGARTFATAQQMLEEMNRLVVPPTLGASDTPSDETEDDTADTFASAAEALKALGRGGDIPDVLARRIRQRFEQDQQNVDS